MDSADEATMLDNRRQARKVRIVFWASLVACGLAFWGGWEVFLTFGLSEADGGVLRPLWERLALGGAVAGLGAAFAGGMLLYISLYALRIERSGDRVSITTMTPLGRQVRVYGITELGESAYHHGRARHVHESGARGGIWVNAPWITLRVVGRRFPFVIDLQADDIDIGALSVLAEGGVGDWRQDRS